MLQIQFEEIHCSINYEIKKKAFTIKQVTGEIWMCLKDMS